MESDADRYTVVVRLKPASTARSRLRLRFAVSVAVGGLGLAALWRPLGAAWVLAALPVGGYLTAYAAVNLAANRPSEDGAAEATGPQAAVDADIVGRLGPANVITLFRGWLVVVLAGALVADPPAPWLPVWLFAGAAGLDAVDGAVARRTRETVLGGRLDAATDALAVLVGAAVAVVLGALPAWYLLAGGVWYAYRRRCGGGGGPGSRCTSSPRVSSGPLSAPRSSWSSGSRSCRQPETRGGISRSRRSRSRRCSRALFGIGRPRRGGSVGWTRRPRRGARRSELKSESADELGTRTDRNGGEF